MAAKRIVNHVAEVPMLLPKSAQLVLTVTLGMAQAPLEGAIGGVVERADTALYAGKRAGRNRFVMAEG
jgi:PleD family two-component response regulator